MLKHTALFIILAHPFASQAAKCAAVAGQYASVSESHWHYDLTVSTGSATLVSTVYQRNNAGVRLEETKHFVGQCHKLGRNSYQIAFPEHPLNLTYSASLSKASFGYEGTAPGFTAKLENHTFELWLKSSL